MICKHDRRHDRKHSPSNVAMASWFGGGDDAADGAQPIGMRVLAETMQTDREHDRKKSGYYPGACTRTSPNSSTTRKRDRAVAAATAAPPAPACRAPTALRVAHAQDGERPLVRAPAQPTSPRRTSGVGGTDEADESKEPMLDRRARAAEGRSSFIGGWCAHFRSAVVACQGFGWTFIEYCAARSCSGASGGSDGKVSTNIHAHLLAISFIIIGAVSRKFRLRTTD